MDSRRTVTPIRERWGDDDSKGRHMGGGRLATIRTAYSEPENVQSSRVIAAVG